MKKIFWALVILILPAFCLWGLGDFMSDESRKPAGRMYGKKVTAAEYSSVRNACMVNALILYGKRFSDLTQYLDFNKQAWDRMLLLDEAKRLGITISNDELAAQLRRLFSVEGEFSKARYEEFIKNSGINPITLEKNVRETMMIGRLTRTIADTAVIPDMEIDEALERINEKRTVDYVTLKDDTYKKDDLFVPEEDLQKYYAENSWQFRVPEKVRTDYLFISIDDFRKKITMSDKEAAAFYQANKEIFKDEKTGGIVPLEKIQTEIKTRLIDQKATDLAFEKATDISISLLHRPDLAAAGKENNLPVKHTDYLMQGQDIPGIDSADEYIAAAFETPAGKISNAVKTAKGFYIICTAERKPSYLPPLADIKDKVAAKVREAKNAVLLKENADNIARELGEKVRKDKLPFVQAAKSMGLDARKAGPFKMTDPLEALSAREKETAFTIYKGEVSAPVRGADCYTILSVEDIEKPDLEKLKDMRAKLRENLLNIKRDKIISMWYRALRQKAQLVDLTDVKKQPAE
jgi:peptidyl-prolyl cis-trans isomerase D